MLHLFKPICLLWIAGRKRDHNEGSWSGRVISRYNFWYDYEPEQVTQIPVLITTPPKLSILFCSSVKKYDCSLEYLFLAPELESVVPTHVHGPYFDSGCASLQMGCFDSWLRACGGDWWSYWHCLWFLWSQILQKVGSSLTSLLLSLGYHWVSSGFAIHNSGNKFPLILALSFHSASSNPNKVWSQELYCSGFLLNLMWAFSWSVSDFIPNETSSFLVVGGETRMALIVRLSSLHGSE